MENQQVAGWAPAWWCRFDVSSNGVARGMARGEALVRVSYQRWSASARVFVMPPDTYRLIGTVTDSGTGIATR